MQILSQEVKWGPETLHFQHIPKGGGCCWSGNHTVARFSRILASGSALSCAFLLLTLLFTQVTSHLCSHPESEILNPPALLMTASELLRRAPRLEHGARPPPAPPPVPGVLSPRVPGPQSQPVSPPLTSCCGELCTNNAGAAPDLHCLKSSQENKHPLGSQAQGLVGIVRAAGGSTW